MRGESYIRVHKKVQELVIEGKRKRLSLRWNDKAEEDLKEKRWNHGKGKKFWRVRCGYLES